MKKLRLEVDALAVESFGVTEEAAPRRGTVKGQAVTVDFSGCASYSPCCGPTGVDGYCDPSFDSECEWTTNPKLDCWPQTAWPDCTA